MAPISDEELTEAIIQASRGMVGIALRSLEAGSSDITLAQYRTLVVLADAGPSRLADLATTLGVSPSTATRMCDRLVRKGLVSRTRDELDRREVNLAVTPMGRQIVDTVVRRRREEVRGLLQSIPPAERDHLLNSLHILALAGGELPEMHWEPGWSVFAATPA